MRRNGALDYAKVSLANRQIFRSYGRLNAADVLTGRYLKEVLDRHEERRKARVAAITTDAAPKKAAARKVAEKKVGATG